MNFSTSAAVFRWKPAAWLRVTGEDAANFLQGQFTNELRGLPAGGAVYGLWLTLKGKVLADSFIVRGGGRSGGGDTGAAVAQGGAASAAAGGAGETVAAEFWIGSYFSPAALIKERLEAYVIADDVTIEDLTAEWEGITVIGDRSSEIGDRGTEVGAGRLEIGDRAGVGVSFRGRRGGEAVEWVFPVAQGEAVRAEVAGRREVGAEEMARRRILAGVPAVPADIGPGDLPGEGALEAEAISYTKGCYLGQEVMARLKSMGQVRRRLARVAGENWEGGKLENWEGGKLGKWETAEGSTKLQGPGSSETPNGGNGGVPAGLFIGEKKVGELRSAVGDGAGGWVGLAMLTLLQVSAGATFSLEAGGKATVRLAEELP